MVSRKHYLSWVSFLMGLGLMLSLAACNLPTGAVEDIVEGLEELELFVSPTGNDTNDCQTPETACQTILRGVQVANELTGATIQIAPGTYLEMQAFIQSPMTLRGAEGVVIRRAPGDTGDAFIIEVDATDIVRFEQITIDGGNYATRLARGRLFIDNVTFNGVSAVQAGVESGPVSIQNSRMVNSPNTVIIVQGPVVVNITNSTISGNRATPIRNNGGIMTLEGVSIFDNTSSAVFPTAILHTKADDGSGGELRISNSAIYNNRSDGGTAQPAILNGAYLEMSNSTISGNTGDGVLIGRDSQIVLTHATIANQTGIGITTWGDIARTSISITNSLIVYNGRDCDLRTTYSAGVPVPDIQNSIDSDNTCRETQSAERAAWDFSPGVDGILRNNGGSTLTHALYRESPAVDAVSCPLGTDQRGVARPQGERCDIGAFELEPELGAPPLPGTPLPLINQTATAGPTLPSVPTLVQTTATSDNPFVRLLVGANCRTGPGTVYLVVTSLAKDTELPAEGRNNDNTWWYVNVGGNIRCWISGTTLQTFGPVSGLPVIPAPPTPVPTNTAVPTNTPVPQVQTPPNPPQQLYIENRVCNGQTYSLTIRWQDTAQNETGFNIYRDGAFLGSVGENQTAFNDAPAFGGPYTYSVESFNGAGASNTASIVESGCIP